MAITVTVPIDLPPGTAYVYQAVTPVVITRVFVVVFNAAAMHS